MDKSRMGKLSRARGARFELKVRANLEEHGWVIDKWTNNVDLEEGKLVKAKRRYNPYMRALSVGNGFPDFIAFKKNENDNYQIIGVEAKSTGNLSKKEKGMCVWLLKNKIFEKILIAKKVQEGRKVIVEYVDFEKKFGNKFLQ